MAAKIVFAALVAVVGLALPAHARSVTTNDITVDVPDGYKSKDTSKGMKLQSGDGALDIWFERYAAGASDQFLADNVKYWKDHDVVLPKEPTRTDGKLDNGLDYFQMDYPDATWKGDPTVVRYVFFAPTTDPKADMIVITIWGTPKGDEAHSAEVVQMIGTAKAD